MKRKKDQTMLTIALLIVAIWVIWALSQSCGTDPCKNNSAAICKFEGQNTNPGSADESKDGANGKDGTSCTVSKVDGVSTIKCGDEVVTIADGTNGKDGSNGVDGKDGESCKVEAVSNGSIITCPNGSNTLVINGKDGVNGTNGVNGTDGKDGKDGRDGTDGKNGKDGTDGKDATPSAYSFTEIIDPCGKQSSFDEVLFKTVSGTIIAHYSHGSKQFLTLVPPGRYVTTDGTNCYFTITSDGKVTW